jgi:hypothetical protein
MRRQSSVFVALAHSTNVLSINSGPVLGHHQQLAGGRQELRHLNRPLSVDFRNTTDGKSLPWCRSPKLDRASVEAAFAATLSVDVADQRFIAKINQHGMVLIIEPAAEDIKTTVSRPG